MDPQGRTAFWINSLQLTTKGLMHSLGHSMGAMGACKRQERLVMAFIRLNRDQTL